MTKPTPPKGTASEWLIDRALRGLIATALLLPYSTRISFFGRVTRYVIAPLAGFTRRSRDNLALIWPERPDAERHRIAAQVSENVGRMLIENYSPTDMARRAVNFPISGDGWDEVQQARAEKRPILVVTGHFGNYEAARAALNHKGVSLGAVYRPMSNPYVNAHYVAMMEAVAGPMFPSGGKGGMTGFVRQLAKGTPMLLLNDLSIWRGETMPFLGQPAKTAISAAEMAIKFNALLVPAYAIRDADNPLDYRIVVEAPIPHSDPITMTQALNQSLEKRIIATPDQWFWIHRRWK
jgi:KDO2-lipid IV(A) lauroyltransferase